MRILHQLVFAILLLNFVSCGHSDTADAEVDFVMSSDDIVSEFLNDEQAANAKYNDYILQVTGPVMELTNENGMVHGIKISSDEFNIVNCTFQHPVEPAEISDGSITVKGVCSGFNGDSESMLPGGTIELKRSTLVQ